MSRAIRSLATRLYQRLTQKSAYRPHAPRHRVRLGLEQFEAREVPAALTWTNLAGNNDFYTASNGVVTGTSTISTAAPMAGDDVTFNGGVSSANCNNLGVLQIPTGGGGTNAVGPMSFASTLTTTPTGLNSLNLINGYAGTVSVVAPLETATFVLSAASTGAISQPASPPGNDITVTQSFTWTRGTLNSSTQLANVNVLGNGSITPVGAGTVSLGSNLIFTGTQPAPKETTINPGTIQLTNAASKIAIGAYYSVKAMVIAEGDVVSITTPLPPGNPETIQNLVVEANGKLTLIGPGTYNTNLLFINRGQFNLIGSVRAYLNCPVGSGYVQQGTAAELRMENGSNLYGTEIDITDGVVYLMMNPNLHADAQTATINGKFVMSKGTILFAPPIGIGSIPLVYGWFTVNGDVDWSGGTYKPSVDYATAGLANGWVVTGKMTSAVACVVAPNPQGGANPPMNSNWQILRAKTTGGALPTVAMGSPLTLGQFTIFNEVVWKLTS